MFLSRAWHSSVLDKISTAGPRNYKTVLLFDGRFWFTCPICSQFPYWSIFYTFICYLIYNFLRLLFNCGINCVINCVCETWGIHKMIHVFSLQVWKDWFTSSRIGNYQEKYLVFSALAPEILVSDLFGCRIDGSNWEAYVFLLNKLLSLSW